MHVIRRRGWEIPEHQATPERLFLDRRAFLAAAGMAGAAALALPTRAWAQRVADLPDPTADLYPAKPNEKFVLDRPVTDEKLNINYNNFYEFGTDKESPSKYAHTLRTRPWSVTVRGEAEVRGRFDLEDLLKGQALEERIYRLRCVEAWSLVVPWIGFPLSNLLARFKPTSKAKYVEFTTLYDPLQMPGQRSRVLNWPYVEGLRIDEAMHPLTLMVVGLYGRILPNQDGAPLRLIVPWKYGFKSIKSIVEISFSARQPNTAWNVAAPEEYGFYANVNPQVDHPRWSQATERHIGAPFLAARRPTLPFNGYAAEVAGLYQGMDLRRYF